MLGAPLLAPFTATAAGATSDDRLGGVSDAWVEIRWTTPVRAQLEKVQAKVEALAPARLVQDGDGAGIRFPVLSGTGDPAPSSLPQAHGTGMLDGGVVIRTPTEEFRITKLEGVLRDGVGSGRCTVGGVDVGMQSVLRCGLGEGRFTAESVPPGQPVRMQLSGMPVRPTQESLKVFSQALGALTQTLGAVTQTLDTAAFTIDTIVAYITVAGVYTPPRH